METSDILKKVRQIEIKTKGLSKHIFSGEYQSAFKGRGMSFSEVRDYQYGDDVRNIDWNVTARTGDPFVKVFEEERELTLMLVVDVSRSALFGTVNQFKNEIITEICAVLAFSAIQNSDKVGAILFAENVKKYIPPKKGKKHILRIIRELLNDRSEAKGTDLKKALTYLNNVQKKKAIVFMVSDFLTDTYLDDLRLANRRHDMIGIRIYDPCEEALPNVGMIRAEDAETGAVKIIDTSSKKVRETYNEWYEKHVNYFKECFKQSKSDTINIRTDEDYVKLLMKFFKKRAH